MDEKIEEKKQEEPMGELVKTIERLEKANSEMKELLKRQEDLYAKKILSGVTDNVQPEPKKEETPAEYAKRVFTRDGFKK